MLFLKVLKLNQKKQKMSDEITKYQNVIQDALDLILRYGAIDGGHHKQWVLDQVVRTLTVTPEGYKKWCEEYSGSDPDDEDNYYGEWDNGCAP